MIDGRCVDFTSPEMDKTSENDFFNILTSTPKETDKYFEREDYSSFYLEFVIAFEKLIGLGKQVQQNKFLFLHFILKKPKS